ncbi:alpha/beta hydrolase [Embleya sp. AB8]|uniref:alpha/beta hydrolase n=1 Tax=Embleya sp. AB8 TaxID=3156304 RepID=UPI003C71DFD6
MKILRRPATALAPAVALAALLNVPAVAAPAADDPSNAPVGAIRWQPCAQDATADCGTLSLPVDWHHPRGARFDLALARRRATDPAHRIGPLVFGPGGPGQSGVNVILRNTEFGPEVRARFDLVGYDPRGGNRSNPLRCDPAVVDRHPSADPVTPAGFAALTAYNRDLAASCRQGTGPLYDHLDTTSVARDVDAIRAALGERRLTFVGGSYGTMAGQRYAELFPHRIRALVVDGNLDHSADTGRFLDSGTVAAEDSFAEFVRWCDADTRCMLHGRDPAGVYARLYQRAEAGTLALPGDPNTRLTPYALSDHVVKGFYEPSWSQLAARLDDLDRQPPGRPTLPPFTPPPNRDTPYKQAMFCSDFRIDIAGADELAATKRRMAALAPRLRLSGLTWDMLTTCLGNPVPVTNPPRPYRVHGAPPILVINSRHDPATPYTFAVEVARQIPRAVLLTYDGWGHIAFERSACVRAAMDRYLIDLRTPPVGTHCAPEPPAAG